MYDWRNILKQRPAIVGALFMALLNMVVAWSGLHPTITQLATTNAFFGLLLAALYVEPLSVSKDALTKLAAKVKGDKQADE